MDFKPTKRKRKNQSASPVPFAVLDSSYVTLTKSQKKRERKRLAKLGKAKPKCTDVRATPTDHLYDTLLHPLEHKPQ